MKNADSMWVVIHMAHSEERAKRAEEMLVREGFLARVRPVARALTAGDCCYEVLSLKAEAKEARDVLQEAGF